MAESSPSHQDQNKNKTRTTTTTMSSVVAAVAAANAAACHAAGPSSNKAPPFRFHRGGEDRGGAARRLPFDRIDENQHQDECGAGAGGGFANCDILHLIMSSSSLSLSNSASSILSTSSLTTPKQQQQQQQQPSPPQIIETDDSGSSSSSSSSTSSARQPPGARPTVATATAAVAAPAVVLSLEQQQSRRLLLGLHHGATCCRKHSLQHGGACPDHSLCAAVKRLYSHILHCRCKSSSSCICMVPGCTKARKVWAHFGRCIDQDCSICTVIPNRSEEKRWLSQKYKTTKNQMSQSTTTTYCQPVAAATAAATATATTSFSKTTAFQMSSLVAAIAASMPTVPTSMRDEHPAGRRPPLSPSRSFTAPFYCYI